jgi:hypothetical protein
MHWMDSGDRCWCGLELPLNDAEMCSLMCAAKNELADGATLVF